MNWKMTSILALVLLFCLASFVMMALPAAAASTESATEPTTEPAEPDLSAMGPALAVGTVLLVVTWAMVIWLLRWAAKRESGPRTL